MSEVVVNPHDKGPRQFDGSLLVTKEDLAKAAESDEYLVQITEYIAQDRGYIQAVKHELAGYQRIVRGLKTRINLARARIESRKRQYQHFLKLLRKRMAFDKIREARKQIGLE